MYMYARQHHSLEPGTSILERVVKINMSGWPMHLGQTVQSREGVASR